MISKSIPHALALGAALVLSACGGGGGDAAPSTLSSVPLTTANYAPVGRASAATLVDVQSSTSLDSIASVSYADGATAASPAGIFSLARFVAASGEAAIGRDRPAASQTSTRACPGGGSATVTATDSNNNSRLDAGDSVSSTFNACATESGATPVSGGLDFTVTGAGYSGSTLTSFSVSATFRALSGGGSTLNGAADLSVSATTASIAYRATASVRNGVTTVYDFTANAATSGGTDTISIAGQIGVSGAAYTLSTPTTIVMGSAYPRSGLLRVADAAGGRVDVIMRATDFDLDLYLAGDSVRDGSTTHTWAQLASGSI